MAESFKYEGDLNEVFKVYPDLPWSRSAGQVKVLDEKKDEYVPLNEGDYIVHIGERYEVSEKKPAKAKAAEVPEPEEEEAKSEDDSLDPGSDVVYPGGEPAEG